MLTVEIYQKRIQDLVDMSTKPIADLNHLAREVSKHKQLTDDEKDGLIFEIDETIVNLENTNTSNQEGLLIYDYSKINVHLEPWENLNPKNYSYPKFLRDIVLPTFHPLPEPDLQNPLLAIYCLINSNSLPPASSGILKELPLSILYVSGASGSGKSELQKRIGTHYPSNSKYMWMGDSTGTSLVRECHRVCHVTDEILRPAYVWMDNFYPSGRNSTINRLGTSYTSVLSVLRSQAVTNSCTPQDTDTYYTHCLKSVSSIMPMERASKEAGELIRRCMFIFTEKSDKVPSAGKYNWLSVRDEYMKFWTKEATEDSFFPILSEVMSLGDDDTSIPAQYFPASGIVIATGCHVGLFDSVKEAVEYLTQYWKWVDDKLSRPTDPTLALIEHYLRNNDLSDRRGGLVSKVKANHNLQEIISYVADKQKVSRTSALQDKVLEILIDKGYKQDVSPSGQIILYR